MLDQGPANGTLTLHNNGTFTYTPTAGFSGSDSFTYTPKDGALAGSPTTVTISVRRYGAGGEAKRLQPCRRAPR